jgi:RNase P subunit RPR2
MASFPRYPLADVIPLKSRDGETRVLLMCGCGHPTDLTFEASATGETGRSYTCEGCGSSHWFKVREDDTND